MFEDELIPLFEKCGAIWDLRLMMDPMTGTNRGYAFVTFTNRESAQNAVKEVYFINGYDFYITCLSNLYINFSAKFSFAYSIIYILIYLVEIRH